MADWIQAHASLPRHPKTRKLMRTLKVDMPTTLGHLVLLWWCATEFGPGGDLSGLEDEDIAEYCQWQGDASDFIKAFVTAGFLEKNKTIHDWEDYNFQHRQRMKDADRQRKKRTADQMREEGKTEKEIDDALKGPGEPTEEPRKLSPDEVAKRNGNPYVAHYVDVMREKGYPDPTKKQKDVFGAKVKEIETQVGEIEMSLLTDAINLMIERDKGPGLLAYLYKDARQISADLDLKARMGGRVR